MTPKEKQDKILEVAANSSKERTKALTALRKKRRKIRAQLGKGVMNLTKTPLELQKDWRDE